MDDNTDIGEKTDDVASSLNAIITALSEADYDAAASAAESLTEMDCSVCQSFGHHLGGIVLAANYAPSETDTEYLREFGVDQATYIRDEIVG